MSLKKQKVTVGGVFRQDDSGLYHYKNISHNHIFDALKDAIKNRPKNAAWFWFNETPAPIYPKDTIKTLLDRWRAWRTAHQSDRTPFPPIGIGSFLDCLVKLGGQR